MENNRTTTAFSLRRRIGSTNYRVNARCSSAAAETFEDKVFRLIRNDAMDIGAGRDIMTVPQTSRQSGRSANEREAG